MTRTVTLATINVYLQTPRNDLMFLVKCLKQPSDQLNIHHYITFTTSPTRFGNSNKLVHPLLHTNISILTELSDYETIYL